MQNNEQRFANCERTCSLDEVPVIDQCLKKVELGERCTSPKQCGDAAECRFGICQCICSYKQSVCDLTIHFYITHIFYEWFYQKGNIPANKKLNIQIQTYTEKRGITKL